MTITSTQIQIRILEEVTQCSLGGIEPFTGNIYASKAHLNETDWLSRLSTHVQLLRRFVAQCWNGSAIPTIANKRVCIKYCENLGKSSTETLQIHHQAFQENSLDLKQVSRWFAPFKVGSGFGSRLWKYQTINRKQNDRENLFSCKFAVFPPPIGPNSNWSWRDSSSKPQIKFKRNRRRHCTIFRKITSAGDPGSLSMFPRGKFLRRWSNWITIWRMVFYWSYGLLFKLSQYTFWYCFIFMCR